MYDHDSFFTLSIPGQIGLSIVSLVLSAVFLWLTLWRAKKTPRLIRLLTSLALFALFVWLTPQIYYIYYLFVFEDLPLQWVLKPPPSAADLIHLMTFSGPSNLSAHSKGLLGWLMLILPQLVSRQSMKQ